MKDKKSVKKPKKEAELPLGFQVTVLLGKAQAEDDLMREAKKNAVQAMTSFLKAFEAEVHPLFAAFRKNVGDTADHPDTSLHDMIHLGYYGESPIRISMGENFFYRAADSQWVNAEEAAKSLVNWNGVLTPDRFVHAFLADLALLHSRTEARRQAFEEFGRKAIELEAKITKAKSSSGA